MFFFFGTKSITLVHISATLFQGNNTYALPQN